MGQKEVEGPEQNLLWCDGDEVEEIAGYQLLNVRCRLHQVEFFIDGSI